MTFSAGAASNDSAGDIREASLRTHAAAMPFPSTNGWVVLAVCVSFLASSAIRRPVPSVNEPHYLGKARHYWQPEWCAGDMFLESSSPHRVFYQTVGVLTRWMTLPQAAWTGRLLALGCLAWGWTRLLSRFLAGRWHPLAAAWVFLLLQSLGDFSGEWLVGGVEAKVFAYAFAFAGLASGLDGRWPASGLWMGVAISYHPVVGLWCVIAAAIAAAFEWMAVAWRSNDGATRASQQLPSSRKWRDAGLGLALMIACGLPGLLPSLALLQGVDPELAARADRLQVGVRLAHHLDPLRFPLSAYRYYALLLVFVALLWRSSGPTLLRRRFGWFVVATLLIAVAGVLIGAGPRPLGTMPLSEVRVWLLKFYPFRLADLFVPVLVSVTVVAACDAAKDRGALAVRHQRAAWILALSAFLVSLVLPTPDRNPSRMSSAQEADWLDACQWIRKHVPQDALLYAANEDWAVKWFTDRPEYVNYKDCPQDAAGIIEWARRVKQVNNWARESFADGRCSAEDLARLHAETGITHLTASRLGPIDVEPVYRNPHFRVYAIGEP